jgi:ATP-dependent DNA helicase PIF1
MNCLPLELLSKEQNEAYQQFLNGENIFVSGPGGSGKTQLLHTLVSECKLTKKEVAVCALTGCAAVLLNVNAKTIHSWSGIKLAKGPVDQIIMNIFKNKKAVSNWKKVNVLIIDEVSMMSQKILDILEETARRIRRCPSVFGGIQIVFTGDFYQLPPVGDPNEPATCNFCFQSEKWNEIFPNPSNSILLKTIFRQSDPVYRNILNELRIGELSEESANILQQRVGIEPNVDVVTRLFPVKSKVETINQYNFDKIEEPKYTSNLIIKTNCKIYIDSGSPIVGDALKFCKSLTPSDIDFEIKRLSSSLPADQTVNLKKGALVMLTVNLSVEDGLCNGSQGIIIDILQGQKLIENAGMMGETYNLPVVKFTNGVIKTIVPKFWQSDDFPCICVGQFPLILAWAVTIHKIQGASINYGIVDAGSSIF